MLKLHMLAGVLGVMGQDCQNPIFADINSWGGTTRLPLDLQQASTPQAFPSGGAVCKWFETNHRDAQCCTNETLATIEVAFDVAQTALDVAREAVETNPFPDAIASTVKAAVDTACALLPCPKGVQATLKSYTDVLTRASVELQEAQVDCIAVQLAYTEGMMCFACEADYKPYIDEASKMISLTQTTCDGVVEGCQPVYDAIKLIIRTVTEMVRELLKEVTGMDLPIDLCSVPDMCGGNFCDAGDCAQFVCHDLLNGFTVPDYSWAAKGSQLQGEAAPSDKAEMKAWLQSHLLALHSDLVTAIAPAGHADGPAADQHNEYAASGYDVLAVGCADVACPSSFPLWAIVLAAVAGVALLAAVTYCAVRRRKEKAELESLRSPLVDDYATSPVV